MNFSLPFGDDVLEQMTGRKMVLSDNYRSEARFFRFQIISVSSGGDVPGGRFEVSDGVLRLYDQQGLFCEFPGLETRNGTVYVVGTPARTASRDGYDRVTMHEQKLLTPGELSICVSSNVAYAPTTLPKLLGSIRKAGFNMSRVVVVIAGDQSGTAAEEEAEGARVLRLPDSKMTMSGLLAARTDASAYWLLLHDTCEAEKSFLDAMGKIDVGLHPDIVWFRSDDDKSMMGLYSSTFLSRIGIDFSIATDQLQGVILRKASIVTAVTDEVVEIGTKDVYGTGHKRQIEQIRAMGIRKFKSIGGRRL
jgi:hypothetical protein